MADHRSGGSVAALKTCHGCDGDVETVLAAFQGSRGGNETVQVPAHDGKAPSLMAGGWLLDVDMLDVDVQAVDVQAPLVR